MQTILAPDCIRGQQYLGVTVGTKTKPCAAFIAQIVVIIDLAVKDNGEPPLL